MEDILVGDIPVVDILVGDIPVVDIPVVDKRPWDIPPVDNLQNSIDPQNQIQTIKFKIKQTNKQTNLVGEEHQQGVVADCNNSFFALLLQQVSENVLVLSFWVFFFLYLGFLCFSYIWFVGREIGSVCVVNCDEKKRCWNRGRFV